MDRAASVTKIQAVSPPEVGSLLKWIDGKTNFPPFSVFLSFLASLIAFLLAEDQFSSIIHSRNEYEFDDNDRKCFLFAYVERSEEFKTTAAFAVSFFMISFF